MPDVGCGKTLCNSAFEFEFNPLVFVMRVTPRIIVRLLSYQTDWDNQLDSETFNFMSIHNSDITIYLRRQSTVLPLSNSKPASEAELNFSRYVTLTTADKSSLFLYII